MADELPDAGWWNRVLAARPNPALQPVLDGLPPEVRAYLSEQSPRLVVWGCGILAAVKELAAAYPACEVAGVELSPAAGEQARGTDPNVPLIERDSENCERTHGRHSGVLRMEKPLPTWRTNPANNQRGAPAFPLLCICLVRRPPAGEPTTRWMEPSRAGRGNRLPMPLTPSLTLTRCESAPRECSASRRHVRREQG